MKKETKGPESPGRELQLGDVPDGWQPEHWRERLEQMAQGCEGIRPERAKYLRRWAEKLRGEKLEVRADG